MKYSTTLIWEKSSPNEEVDLRRVVEIEFLAGINHNTLLVIYIQYMTIFDIIIPCNALHWAGKDTDAVPS